jgi:hypothetical protein
MAQQTLVGQHLRDFTITLRYTTPGKIPLDESSVGLRYLNVTNNTHKRQTSMPSAEFETAIPASELLQTNALDCAAKGIGKTFIMI